MVSFFIFFAFLLLLLFVGPNYATIISVRSMKNRTGSGILSASGGNGFGGGAGGRISVNVFSRHDDQTFFAHGIFISDITHAFNDLYSHFLK